MAHEEALDRAEAKDEILRAEGLTHFLDGGVPVGAKRRHDRVMASFDALRAAVAAQRLRPGFALLSFARAPTAYTRRADPETFASLAVARARVHRPKNANSQIK
jgi:hypothetical protein